jgi:hypothetical protein
MKFGFNRASLSLSINAIVVLILAITILGLGLGFIKNQFGGMNERFEEVTTEMRKEMTDKIKSSGELLVFNVLAVDVSRGVEKTFFMGIQNTDTATRCYTVLFECIQPLTGVNCDPSQSGGNYIVGGENPASLPGYPTVAVDPLWIQVFKQFDIGAQDVGVYPVKIQMGSPSPDTYMMEVVVFKQSSACAMGGTWDFFQKKQFYIKLK